MPNHNILPDPETQTQPRRSIVQYPDGTMAIEFLETGDTLVLGGPESKHKYAQAFHGPASDMAIIETRSGNVYGIGQGLVANEDRQEIHHLPDEPIVVTIGEPCVIPGVATTTEVEKLLLRYKYGAPGSGSQIGARQEPTPNPFKAFAHNIARVQNPKQ